VGPQTKLLSGDQWLLAAEWFSIYSTDVHPGNTVEEPIQQRSRRTVALECLEVHCPVVEFENLIQLLFGIDGPIKIFLTRATGYVVIMKRGSKSSRKRRNFVKK
jgi:hypothetical protein